MISPTRIVRNCALGIAMMSAFFFLNSCSDMTGPQEQHQNITISREIEFAIVDSFRMTAIDTFDAGLLSAAFNAVKERITRVGCTSPTLTVVEFNGATASIIDTLFLYVGPQSANPVDTLTGPALLTRTQLTGGAPQVMWVNSPNLWFAQNLLGHAPYGFALRAYVHSTHPITRVRIRLEFPLDVNYLN